MCVARDVKENKIAGVALLLVSGTRNPSPENHANDSCSHGAG